MINGWLSILVTFLAGIGIGTIVSTLIQKNYEHRKLIFEIKLLKYGKLIEALQNAVADSSQSAKQITVSAQKQVELVGTEEIISLSRKLYNANSDFSGVRDALVKSMREDLNKYYH